MKINFLVTTCIILTLSLSVFANKVSIHNTTPILYQYNFDGSSDSTNNVSQNDINIYKLIISGKEDKIKGYFREVSADELSRTDSGGIAKAFKRLNTNDKVSRTIWILEEVKNRNVEVRAYVYNELLKVDFGKPPFLLNHMINNYFTNYTEKEVTLSEKVRKLHKKMNR